MTLDEKILDYLCQDCGHKDRHHAGHIAACAECWRQMMTICERFRIRDSDIEELIALT